MKVFDEGERVYLREVELSDVPLIVKWKDDLLVRQMSVGIDTEITEENQEIDIKRAIEEEEQLYLVIVVKATEKAIGYVRIDWLDNMETLAWLRFGLGEERGKGYAKESLKITFRRLFHQGAHRIDAEVYEFNNASNKLLQSIGFKHEGTRRKAQWAGANYADVYVLGLLEEDLIE